MTFPQRNKGIAAVADVGDRLLQGALLPVLLPQALWVSSRALRLPEAAGARSGRAGRGPALRLLIAGDSSAAGVGVPDQADALSGQLARQLAGDCALSWRLEAKTGATTRATLAALAALAPDRFDAALIALGVNDATRLRSPRRWLAEQRALRTLLRDRFGVRLIVVSAVPPIDRFPLLPQPLRGVLGRHGRRLDRLRAADIAAETDCRYLPFEAALEPGHMASDGFHPGAEIYALWAARAAAVIRQSGVVENRAKDA